MNQLEKLSPSPIFKVAMYAVFLLSVAGVILTKSGIYGLPIALAFAIAAFSQTESYYLSDRYIKKRKSKILSDEITEVRSLLGWWIITDINGDSIWVNRFSMKKEEKVRLSDWIAQAEKEIKANQSVHTTRASARV